MLKIAAPAIAVMLASAVAASAQMNRARHMAGMQPSGPAMPASAGLSEPGQGAFAALSEVVALLEADPATDWERVDLAGLRAHLVDMNWLVLEAQITEETVPGGLLATARGDARTLAALRRMVPAHAAQLARDPRWTVAAAETGEAVTLRVTSPDPGVTARIRGLGFFGLMASQDHHRAHHLMIARGASPHGG